MGSTRPRPGDEFSPRLLSVLRAPPPPLPRLVLRLVLLLIALLMVWAYFGKLDIVARAGGALIPASRLQIVQPNEAGRVAEILVAEGEEVRAGQPLLLMDAALAAADGRKLELDLDQARLQLRRVNAELTETPFTASGETPARFAQARAQYEANRHAYLSQVAEQRAVAERLRQEIAASRALVAKLQQTLPIYVKNEQVYAEMAETGDVPELDLLERRKQRIAVERDLQAQQHTLASLEAELAEALTRAESIEAAYRQRLLNEQIELTQRIAQLSEDLGKQAYRNRLLELRAPENGIVKDLAVHTVGSVVPAGTVLMTVVPIDEPLKAEVFIEHTDIGFVQPGQTAKLKLASYSFQRYGMIDAVVEHVSPDAAEADSSQAGTKARGYRALLSFDRQYLERDGRRFALRPGMQIAAEINTGSRTVLEYLLSPVQKTVSEAAHER